MTVTKNQKILIIVFVLFIVLFGSGISVYFLLPNLFKSKKPPATPPTPPTTPPATPPTTPPTTPPAALTGSSLNCKGDKCTSYVCKDNCKSPNTCLGNVCIPTEYNCATDCKSIDGGIPNCFNNMCYMGYKTNPNNNGLGCVSTKTEGEGEKISSLASIGGYPTPKYCNNNAECIGLYYSGSQDAKKVFFTATDVDPHTCNNGDNSTNYNTFFYKQGVIT
jgi:hypothetical protein